MIEAKTIQELRQPYDLTTLTDVHIGEVELARPDLSREIAAEREARQNQCSHEEKDHSICLECGKDCFDDDLAAAEAAYEARLDR